MVWVLLPGSMTAPPRQPAYLRRRVSRPHPANADGVQILAPSIDELTAAERKRLPARVAKLFESLPKALAKAPAPFDWLPEALAGRYPVLERSTFDEREYWHVRWTGLFDDRLASWCIGCDAEPSGRCPKAVPEPLAWLRKTFGTFGLNAESASGTAPFGRTLAEITARERAAFAEMEVSLASEPFAGLPRGAERWISLYELDGDWVFADLEKNDTVWTGLEWTGEQVVRFSVPWKRAASFILWRMLEGGIVTPLDLRMLRG